MILPSWVAGRLSGSRRQGDQLDEGDGLSGAQAETLLELSLIGETAVLSPGSPDELELRAALAYAEVKRKRRELLHDLALRDRDSLGRWLRYPQFYQKLGEFDDEYVGRNYEARSDYEREDAEYAGEDDVREGQVDEPGSYDDDAYGIFEDSDRIER